MPGSPPIFAVIRSSQGPRMVMSPSCRRSPPEAFSSPSVTTIWRKLCSPYSSQMCPRSSSDLRDASMRAVAPLLTL